MTCHDAAVLSAAGARQRPLLAAVLRLLLERSTEEDRLRCPARGAGESMAAWMCRLQGTPRGGPPPWTPAQLEQRAVADLARATTLGVQAIPIGNVRYPPPLAVIDDPPPLLWATGDLRHLSAPAVAVVGSRAASPSALEAAWRVASGLAAAGVAVVSGLARGVDAQAHQAALAGRGCTIAVLGSGHDWIYPAEHRPLARRITAAGLVLSEFGPDVPPRAYQFPLRNRIISGLCGAVVVVEAAERSGALITASCALRQGRDVMVVPGTAIGGRNRGGHRLIRDGARLVESAEDVLEDLGLDPQVPRGRREQPDSLSQLIDDQEFTVDDLAKKGGWTPAEVLARLLPLEVSGRIQRIGGARFVRTSGRVLT